MQATRSKPRCKEDCEEHVFQIKNNNGNTKLDAHVNFCPKFRRDPHRPEKTIPQYNLDHKYYTHAFVLGTEMKTLRNNTQQQQMHFQTLIKDACEKNNQVVSFILLQMFPRPSEKNCYCSVCKEHFRNYFEHINTETHRIKIDAAIYNTEIKRLADTFKSKWEGAHAKVNDLLNQLARQNELYQKAKVSEEQSDEQQEEEAIQEENDNEPSAEAEDENQNQEQANQEQNNESGEEEQQQQQQNQNDIQERMEEEKKPIQYPIDDMEAQKQLDSGNLLSQQKVTPEYTTKHSVNSEFFQKRTQLVVFLRKNKNGKYEIARDIEKILMQKNTGSSEEKETPNMNINNKIPASDRELRNRQERKKSMEVVKKGREILKIKNPQKQRSSQYNGNSSYQFNEEEAALCQNLKDRVLLDRVRTRNQCKQEKVDRVDRVYVEPRNEKIDKKEPSKQKSKSVQEHPAYKGTMPHHPPYPYYGPPMHPYPNLGKGQQPGKQMMGNPKMPHMPPYPMYLPPTQGGNQPMMKSSPGGGRMPPPSSYMPHPSMMMNPPPYFGYMQRQNPNGVQKAPNNNPPTNNSATNSNVGDKKQRPPAPYPPMYYPNAWSPYMMNTHPMMRQGPGPGPEGNGEQPQQPPMNMPPRQPMVYPPNPYHMMPPPPPPSSSSNTSKPATQGTGPGMPHNPNMYMQYQMDPRYFMGYPNPNSNGFAGKKAQQGQSGPPPPPARDPR